MSAELLTKNQINALKAPDVKAYAVAVTETVRSMIEQQAKLNDQLFNEETGVVTLLQRQLAACLKQLAAFEGQLAVSQRVNEALLRHVDAVEETATSNAQYARRDTLELHGVPPSFGDGEELDSKVISLLKDIAPDAGVQASEIQAIHRLKKRQNVIVKFVNRKTKHAVIVNKKKLGEESVKRRHKIEGSIWLNESMCLPMRHLYFLCRLLKQGNHIAHYSFFNGNIRVKLEQDGERATIRHINDLSKLTGLDRKAIEDLAN
jgi:hypothetical protein